MTTETDNSARMDRADEALKGYDGSPDEALIDLLTDLRHWCEGSLTDFEEAVRISGDHFAVES